ncbi:hypothetical protein B6U91_01675, partial [Candidatus Pacearchaeota archaeon ex4484_71]
GTTVFVNIEGLNKQGSMNFSEVAPGRIRNIRDYVVPKKSIICKVLKISPRNVELSLRRVTPKEQKEVREHHKLERSYKSILKSILKEKTDEIIEEILSENTLYEFLEEAKENPEILEKKVGKTAAKEILEILKTQKKKKLTIKKKVKINTSSEEGINDIKKIFEGLEGISLKYISAGNYSLIVEGEDIKKLNNFMNDTLKDLEKKAKKKGVEFSVI